MNHRQIEKKKTKVNSFRNKFLTINKSTNNLQISIPTDQDFFFGIQNNVQKNKDELKSGVPSQTAIKYIVNVKDKGCDLMMKIFDEEDMAFVTDNPKRIEGDDFFYENFVKFLIF